MASSVLIPHSLHHVQADIDESVLDVMLNQSQCAATGDSVPQLLLVGRHALDEIAETDIKQQLSDKLTAH